MKSEPKHSRRRIRRRPPLLIEHERYCNGGCHAPIRDRAAEERASRAGGEYESLMVRKALLNSAARVFADIEPPKKPE